MSTPQNTDLLPVTRGSTTHKVSFGDLARAAAPAATTAASGLVQLADAAAITAGTAGRVVDAAQLKAAVPDATTTSKGIVQLADAAAVTAGTAGRVVDAAQLKAVSDADDWTRTGTEIHPKVAGDSVFTTGAVKVGGTTAAPNIQLGANGAIHGVGTAAFGPAYKNVSCVAETAAQARLQINAQSNDPAYSANGVAISVSKYWNTGKTAEPFIVTHGGNITYTGTLTPPSDATLKEAIVDADLDNQWDDVKRIQLRKYQWKGEPERGTMLGVIAQELETVSPGLIVKDLDDDGNVVDGSCKVKVDALYMKMLGALQVAQQRIETLEAEVTALKGGTTK